MRWRIRIQETEDLQMGNKAIIKELMGFIDMAHSGLGDDCFIDGLHLTNKGNKMVSEIIYYNIKDLVGTR